MRSAVVTMCLVAACGEAGDPMGDTCDVTAAITIDGPAAVTRETSATFTFEGDELCTFECSLDGETFAACTSPHTVTVAEGEHTFEVRAAGGTTTTHSWAVDLTSPTTQLGCPTATVASSTVDITFSSVDPSAAFHCKVDDEAEAPCTSPFSVSGLVDDTHTVTVFAVDGVGNQETPMACSFVVDTTGPAVNVTRSPTSCSLSNLIEFDAVDALDSVTFTCSLDGAAATECGIGENAGRFFLQGLAAGDHAVEIIAHDALGNPGPTKVVELTIVADADPPTVGFDSSPQVNNCSSELGVGVSRASGTVTFTATDNGSCANLSATATCTLRRDTGAGPTAVPGYPDDLDCADLAFEFGANAGLPPLPSGTYTLAVTATDAVNNSSTSSRVFIVDATPPVPQVFTASNVVGTTPSGLAVFGVDDVSAQTPALTCTIDGAAATCNSGTVSIPALPPTVGGYLLEINAVDCVGNTAQLSQRFFVGITTLFTFTGAVGNEATVDADLAADGLALSAMSRGPGVTAQTAANAFNTSSWTTGTAIDLADYVSFTITPDAGATMTLQALQLDERRSATGIRQWSVRSSLDGFATDLAVFAVPDDTNTRTQRVTLPAAFAQLTSPVEFRVYGFEAESAGGTWRIDNVMVEGFATP